ncbi:MAG: cytochrome c [Acidimicrobiia bacterium]|nr:cytochrome c [Acidimicrobiia bacterium]
MKRVLVSLVLIVCLAGCAESGLVGADLFGQRCASCHGAEGAGGIGPAIDGSSAAVDLVDDQLEGVIRVGPGSMPSFDTLTDEQIQSLVDHIRVLQSGP